MSKCLGLSISILAFLTGWALSASYLPTLVLAFLLGVVVTLFIVGSVPYRALVHGCAWRTALGKATAAGLLWAYATLLLLPYGWLLFLTCTDILPPHGPPLMGQFISLTLVATYGVSGAAICRWVSRCAEKSGCLERAA